MISNSSEKEYYFLNGETDETAKRKTSTRLWSALRNPRVVRVSQTFGGKDRHSKVRTIRGLRDRRVRLSVPTAIQLYDLQHKLGLNQPSKVVDWLLNASQHEIDKLPPLPPLPPLPESLIQLPDQSLASSSSAANGGIITENDQLAFSNGQLVWSNSAVFDQNSAQFQKSAAYWNSDVFLKENGGKFHHDFHQIEPNGAQGEVAQGFVLASGSSSSLISLMPVGSQLMVPSVFSLYGNNHSNFQMPSSAQLLPWNSSRTFFHAGREQERKQ